MSASDLLDCVIIGAGAAGLTAATYLARFQRRFAIIDGGASRLLSIPTSHNYPGFVDGIHGTDLLARLRAHAAHYGAHLINGTVDRLDRLEDGSFVATCGERQWHARTAILATGVVDVEPCFPDVRRAVADGHVRYCPICDGFESIGKRVAVLGRGKSGFGESLFVRHYSDDVSLFTLSEPIVMSREEAELAAQRQVRVVQDPVDGLVYDNGAMWIRMHSGASERFDVVYGALGTMVNSGVAQMLGAKWTGNGELEVDAHQQTTVDGLYAIGDIVPGLNQIAVAMGHAAIAATAIHNRLNR
ncbi:MAG TPA: NAD(P)/FAD-dependent oxidoreductase [Noviherbaspirillum sp.]